MSAPLASIVEKADDQAAIAKLQQTVAAMVREQNPLPGLQQLELHVYHLVAEDEIRGRSWRLLMPDGTTWEEVDDLGNAIAA